MNQSSVSRAGSLHGLKRGTGPEPRPRILLAAHMDAIGMMVTQIVDGFLRFTEVGGIDDRILPGQLVTVHTSQQDLPAVVVQPADSLLQTGSKGKPVMMDGLFIDTGLLPEEVNRRFVELLAAFTVQEEIGGRGAKVGAYSFNPDAAFVIDCTPANDLPVWDGSENSHYNTRLGFGPSIYVADNLTLSDPRLIRHLLATAEKDGIPISCASQVGANPCRCDLPPEEWNTQRVSLSARALSAHLSRDMPVFRLAEYLFPSLYCHQFNEPADPL